MAKNLVTGVAVCDGVLQWATLQRGKRALAVVKQGEVAMPAPELADEEGAEPVDPEGWGTALRASLRPRGATTLALPHDKVLLRTLKLPAVDDDELLGMVELQVDKLSPFPVDMMVMSHEVVRRTEDECLVLVAAAREDYVQETGGMLREAGLRVHRVDAVPLARWQAVRDSDPSLAEGRHVLLFLDGGGLEIVIAEDGVPVVFRSIGNLRDLDEGEAAAEAGQEVGYALMTLELEFGAGAIVSASAWSPDGIVPAVVEALGTACGQDVKVRSLGDLVTVAEGVVQRTVTTGGDGIDLTPASWVAAGISRRFKKQMLISVCAVTCLWLILMGGFFGGLAYQRVHLSNLKGDLEAWRKPAMAVRDMRRRVFTIKRYMDRTHSGLECLLAVVDQIPPKGVPQPPNGMTLTSFSYRKGENVRISGEAADSGQVYSFKRNLDALDLFPESTLIGPRRDNRKKKEVFDITISLPEEES